MRDAPTVPYKYPAIIHLRDWTNKLAAQGRLPANDEAEDELFPPPAFIEDDELGELILLDMAELPRPPAPRLRRGGRRITPALAGLWCVSALTVAASLVAIGAGLLAGLAALSDMGAGR